MLGFRVLTIGNVLQRNSMEIWIHNRFGDHIIPESRRQMIEVLLNIHSILTNAILVFKRFKRWPSVSDQLPNTCVLICRNTNDKVSEYERKRVPDRKPDQRTASLPTQ